GINTRWGMPTTDSTKRPAPNVINYPWDNVMQAAEDAALPIPVVGDGIWDRDGYWTRTHPGVTRP
ncbi:MAG: hypothetical protein GWN87_21980, partial [Desulfuromonadales bacterium]|nr:hypothetical protein [Desulfuromonadales bacterium]